jgi:hypothetical protein
MFREGRRHTGPLAIIGALWLGISACGSPTEPSVPNVQGFWRGTWVADACTGTSRVTSDGVLTSFCDQTAGFGSFNLRVTQSDRALRAFIYVCGQEINEVTGLVAADGTITLSGQGVALRYDAMTLSSFKATTSGTLMTGTFACTVNVSGSSSNTYSFGWQAAECLSLFA